MTARQTLSWLRGTDLVIVPGVTSPTAPFPEPVLQALRSAHRRGAPVAALCLGAFVLAQAGLSERTFARRFLATTGTTPVQWLIAQRVLRAQRLLEQTDPPMDRIAAESGFGSPVTLRRHFVERVGLAPRDYRRSFRRVERPRR